jgi:hypothetical protein
MNGNTKAPTGLQAIAAEAFAALDIGRPISPFSARLSAFDSRRCLPRDCCNDGCVKLRADLSRGTQIMVMVIPPCFKPATLQHDLVK